MSAHNIGFYEDLTKIIFQLSSNTHLISSSFSTCLCSVNAYRSSHCVLTHIVAFSL